MKIALYEVNQALAPHGLVLKPSADFIQYTVALAEGNRRNASREDQFAARCWTTGIARPAFVRLTGGGLGANLL